MSKQDFGWFGIIRLGIVQTALGAIIILTTSTLNRVMVVELALPAVLPGALVGWHYAVQMSRPRWGYGADRGGARAPWIIGGVGVLGLGAIGASASAALMGSSVIAGVVVAAVAFTLIGIGVGAAGTNLLALLAMRTAPSRKAAAAAIVWIMMIVGFVLTAGVAGAMLDPFSMGKLITVTAIVCAIALVSTMLAVWGIEPKQRRSQAVPAEGHRLDKSASDFRAAVREIWEDNQARRFTIFVFASMLAYSAQDLILEPFAGIVYGLTPGESTSLAGVQNGGVLLGMIATAIIGTLIGKSKARFMRLWTMGGCIASGIALAILAIAAVVGPTWPLRPSVFFLGLANGAFAVAAIGSMMTLASAGSSASETAPSGAKSSTAVTVDSIQNGGREGTRMGLWGAAQAIAFGLGGFIGAASVDVTRTIFEAPGSAFAIVFAVEGIVFFVAAYLALRVGKTEADSMTLPAFPSGETLPAE
ncbi:MAG: BCD family MFS transporter [Pseudomonadota bacterium]